jgi:hypothetical protein
MLPQVPPVPTSKVSAAGGVHAAQQDGADRGDHAHHRRAVEQRAFRVDRRAAGRLGGGAHRGQDRRRQRLHAAGQVEPLVFVDQRRLLLAGVELDAGLEVEDRLVAVAEVLAALEAQARAVGAAADDLGGAAALPHDAGVGNAVDFHAGLGQRR